MPRRISTPVNDARVVTDSRAINIYLPLNSRFAFWPRRQKNRNSHFLFFDSLRSKLTVIEDGCFFFSEMFDFAPPRMIQHENGSDCSLISQATWLGIRKTRGSEFLSGSRPSFCKKRIGVIYATAAVSKEKERKREKRREKRRMEGERIAEASEIFKGHNEEI
jgi:hypothetical protein